MFIITNGRIVPKILAFPIIRPYITLEVHVELNNSFKLFWITNE